MADPSFCGSLISGKGIELVTLSPDSISIISENTSPLIIGWSNNSPFFCSSGSVCLSNPLMSKYFDLKKGFVESLEIAPISFLTSDSLLSSLSAMGGFFMQFYFASFPRSNL